MVLLAKISNWFLNFNNSTNLIINGILFSLIGIRFIYQSFTIEKKSLKLIFQICGFLLIILNFFIGFWFVALLQIMCILIPILIRKYVLKSKSVF